jgi:hypothetical protein
MRLKYSFVLVGLLAATGVASAAPAFVNGLAIDGATEDLSGDATAFARRVGFFSDIYYDPNRKEWWGVSDRGPGGGTLSYETRAQRFTLDVDSTTGAISNFQIAQTVKFTNGGAAMNGLAPNPSSTLGNSFDPEGFVVNPKTGNFLVSDEYGPSVYEYDRSGNVIRQYTIPDNLVPKVGGTADYVSTPPTLTEGREPNRGFEGLAISPDGNYAYAMLQNGTVKDGWTGGTRGQYTRIVKFDTDTGLAVAQYAYQLQSSGQGRGISAIVAVNDHQFLVLERNNRGIGVGATLASPDKNVFMIDLAGASDVTGLNLPASGSLPAGYAAVTKYNENNNKFLDLDANTLAVLGNKSPEKWEGLAIGPKLGDGSYLMLAGTDNDYSVTQVGGTTQYDVWYNFANTDPYLTSLFCSTGGTSQCWNHDSSGNLTTAATWSDSLSLLPGVLHAYKASSADLAGYVAPVPVPAAVWLFGSALAGVIGFGKRRKA